ncbi:MAG TPA: CoA-transferase [Dehalococcoidia bacterium]|nr:CoA-transferase [Dehalococcoidia bacterium]
MPERKLLSAPEAINRFVSDGDTVYAGYTSVCMGLTYEIVRQRKRHLEIVGGSVGIQATVLALSGCIDRVRAGYIAGALRPGIISEMMDSGELKYEDYSNQAIALMLMAGALGIPFIPTRSFLGSDYLDPANEGHPGGYLGNNKWAQLDSPFDGQKTLLLPALTPDVTILPAQRADEFGNVQLWGHMGDAKWAFWAGKKVVVAVEEIVPNEAIRNDPGRTVVPGFMVSAVVHMPYSAHPSSMAGYYDTDYAFQRQAFDGISRSSEAFAAFADEWIYGCPDRETYVRHYVETFGQDALQQIRADTGPDAGQGIRYTYSNELRFP